MRRFCYTNGVDIKDGTADITKICHSPSKFEFNNISAGQVSPYTPDGPLPQLIGEFVDSVLITQRLEYEPKCCDASLSKSVLQPKYSTEWRVTLTRLYFGNLANQNFTN